MRRPLRILSLSLFLACATLAGAQGKNSPANRGEYDSFSGTLFGAPRAFNTTPFNTSNGIGHPIARSQVVTPVPEPSQWAMMIAGLFIVGFIVRRGASRR